MPLINGEFYTNLIGLKNLFSRIWDNEKLSFKYSTLIHQEIREMLLRAVKDDWSGRSNVYRHAQNYVVSTAAVVACISPHLDITAFHV